MKRVPILISEHGIALLSVFEKKTDDLEDCWSWDVTPPAYKGAATRLVEILHDEACAAFWIELAEAVHAELIAHDKDCGTKFADRSLAALHSRSVEEPKE